MNLLEWRQHLSKKQMTMAERVEMLATSLDDTPICPKNQPKIQRMIKLRNQLENDELGLRPVG
jgi:hypothetical protein